MSAGRDEGRASGAGASDARLPEGPLTHAVALADDVVAGLLTTPVEDWMWGQGLFACALTQLQDALGEPRYAAWLDRYLEHWLAHPPRIDAADRCAPALAARAAGERYRPLVDRVLAYVTGEPRLAGDMVNHLGTSGWARVYPPSVWVDSLMMFGVLPAVVGRDRHDEALVDLAARQPRQYASVLMDGRTGLWAHSYWPRSWATLGGPGRPFPRSVFWGRGNGWVVMALGMILQAIGPDHAEADAIRAILRRTSDALLNTQRPDGTFPTVLTGPLRGYRELSATALIAGGWLGGVAQGALPATFDAPARRALDAVTAAIRPGRDGRLVLPEISGPTIPLPFAPRLGYLLVPRRSNEFYGVAAYLFAALAAQAAGVSPAGRPPTR